MPPQTAAQINDPQTGRIELPPQSPQPKPVQKPKPEGWWNVDSSHPGHRGNVADVLAKIEACEKIPADDKAYLISKIKAMEAAAVEVHAHCTPEGSGFSISIRINKLF